MLDSLQGHKEADVKLRTGTSRSVTAHNEVKVVAISIHGGM